MTEISIAFQTDKTPSDYIALAQLVDQYAFDRVSVYCDLPYQPSFAPLLLMAPHLKRARLGTAAIPPSRMPPIDIATQAHLLAQLASGGIYIGVARGAWLEAHGIRELTPPLLAIRESVAVIRYFLEGQTGGYAGQLFQIAAHVTSPFPPLPRIPIMIGTWGQALGAIAGEIADEVKIGGSANPDMLPVMQGYIAAGERKAGRAAGTVSICIGAVTVVDEDREQARHIARRAVALYLPVVAPLDPTVTVEPELVQRLQLLADQQDFDSAAHLISDTLLEKFAFAGNPADIIQQTEALFAAGAGRVEFGTPHGLDAATGIRLLGEKVLPHLSYSSRSSHNGST